LKKDQLTNEKRTAHIKVYYRFVPAILILTIISMVVGFLIFSSIICLLVALFVVLMGSFYPIYFKPLTRYIFMFKNMYVSSVHAILVLFPYLYYQTAIHNWQQLLAVFFLVLIEVIIMQIALDAKDIEGDKKEKLKTFPVKFGKKKSVVTILTLSFLSLCVFVPISFLVKLNQVFDSIVIASFLVNLTISYLINKNDKKGYLLSAAKFFLWLCVAVSFNILL
jgi:4-hydroxybenzoate polyprenyltransferase